MCTYMYALYLPESETSPHILHTGSSHLPPYHEGEAEIEYITRREASPHLHCLDMGDYMYSRYNWRLHVQ